MDLLQCRKEIDDIDKELVNLFERRMNIAKQVAEYKLENNIPIFDSSRELEVIEKNLNRLSNKEYCKSCENFFIHLMDISKSIQEDLIFNQNEEINFNNYYQVLFNENDKRLYDVTIGYQGVKGSFSEEAMIKYFGENHITTNYEKFEDVFLALKNEEIDYGILPIENSCTGSISKVYDLLAKYGFYITGEECIKIEQNLIGVTGASMEDIEEIYSHPQGFEQSKVFLDKCEDLKLIPFYNTAISAKHISQLNDKSKAAIGSKRAARIYGLDIIEEDINDKDDNNTKFIIIGKKLESSKESDKITVVFSLDNNAGTLYKLLRNFAENNINMIKIESRPSRNEPWQYVLYVDFEGNIYDKEVKKAIKLIEGKSEYFKLLGCYKKSEC